MIKGSISLIGWLTQQGASEGEASMVAALGFAAREIAEVLSHAPLAGQLGALDQVNVQGEQQQQLDVICNDIMVAELARCPDVSIMVSEEVDDIIVNQNAADNAQLVVCFDPLDGSSNIETNGTVGSIFSILQTLAETPDVNSILSAVHRQVVAGYFLYGPSTLLVLTTGKSVAMFGLNDKGAFELVKADIKIPEVAAEFSINMAYRQYWQSGMQDYIEDCLVGKNGPRGKNFNMRWMGSMVADMHRIFMRGGIFIYPQLSSSNGEDGKLRFLYEVNPLAMLVEAAGGGALINSAPLQDFQPNSLHQRAPFAAGSLEEVTQLSLKRDR